MVDTVEDAPAPAPHRPTTVGDRIRFVLRGIGQTLITLGVVVLLFVVYEVYVTNYFAEEAQAKVKTEILNEWKNQNARDPLIKLPGQSTPDIPEGQGIAFIYIPRLGRDYGYAIVQATQDADLEKGPGHYKNTQFPGQVGNFAVAGHRVGKGEPFLNLDHLRAGDSVIIQTKSWWYVYNVKGANGDITAKDADGLPGREIVDPGDGKVLLPYPDHPGEAATERLMTMTTCHPKFTAESRMIIYSKLTTKVKASGLTMPASIKALYDKQGS